MPLTQMCLCFLTRTAANGQRQVLLGLKKTGFGAGKVVGLGGHVDAGESPIEAAVREVAEESGLVVDPALLQKWAVLTFRFPSRPQWNQVVSVFGSDQWTGEAVESGEITPEWIPIDDLPMARMWDDARYWLPLVLADERLRAEITFADDCQTVAHSDVGPLDQVTVAS